MMNPGHTKHAPPIYSCRYTNHEQKEISTKPNANEVIAGAATIEIGYTITQINGISMWLEAATVQKLAHHCLLAYVFDQKQSSIC